MKRIATLICVLIALLSTSALALTVAEVGDFDTYKDFKNENLNEYGDISWIAEEFGYDPYTMSYDKWESGWLETSDDPTAVYIDFTSYFLDYGEYPIAFIVKSGAPGAFEFNDGTNYVEFANNILFTNIDSLQYGLIDTDWFSKYRGNFDIYAISHISAGGGAPIPEPSTLILLGAGLLGVVALRRRKH